MKEQVLLIGWGNTAQFFAQRISQSKQFEVAAIATRALIKNCPFNNISIKEISLNFELKSLVITKSASLADSISFADELIVVAVPLISLNDFVKSLFECTA